MAVRPRVLFLTTGGTLGMLRRRQGGLEPGTTDLLSWLHGLEEEVDIQAETVFNLDSSDVGVEHWEQLGDTIAARIGGVDGIVVTHGTDTMAWTASALSFMLRDLPRPVVLTGAQRPISFVRTDARANLIHSALCAVMPSPEVSVWFGRWLFRGNRVTKTSVESYEAFASPDLPPLVEMGVEVRRITPPLRPTGPFRVVRGFCREVAVLPVVPGTDARMLDAAVAVGVRGVVLRGFGSGNVPQRAWPAAVERACRAGVAVVVHTQCQQGGVELGSYPGGRALLAAGALPAGTKTLEATTVKLMHLLAQPEGMASWAEEIAGEG
jgi:L-asparaginase